MKKIKHFSSEELNILLNESRDKINILIKNISEFKRENKSPIYQISAFLLESQLVEFYLRNLLQEIEIASSLEPELIKMKSKKDRKEYYEMTLGNLIAELDKYESPILKQVKDFLPELNKIRIKFAHHLFELGKISDLVFDSKKGMIINDKLFYEINAVTNYIDKNTKLGKQLKKTM